VKQLALAIFLACALIPAVAQTRPGKGEPALWFGTAWYPEQWPEQRWDTDLQLMQEAGINFVRVGEFAWSTMEPREGQFEFGWLERAVAAAQKHGIYVVLGTPTAAPPAWLTQKYPETLRIEEDGRRDIHGAREQFSFTSPRYREFCRRIAGEMARHFGHNPNVIGWQIDNEYSALSYDDYTRKQFQLWLKAKYKTLDSLNSHWTTAYWSQTYDNWDEIPIPRKDHNPSLLLEWKRFISDTYKDYQHNQIVAIRAAADPRQFITHNFMGWFDGFDHYVVSAELTFPSWDNYVGEGHLDPVGKGLIHDLTRGFKRTPYWVMETQPGSVNWAPINNSLDQGEVREMAWEDVGHGADAVSYWQWRSALGGQEQIHGTLLGPDGLPVPVYDEVRQIGGEFSKAADALAGTQPVSSVAIVHDYDSRWAIQFQRNTKDFDTLQHYRSWYRPLQRNGLDVDVVSPSAPLAGYKLVLVPELNVLPDSTAQKLVDYVKQGGHLVLGPRSGQKDEYNALHPARQPGKVLIDLLGGQVEQYYALLDPVPVTGDVGSGEAKIWAERLQILSPGTTPLMEYGKSNGWLDGRPAVITRQVGRGRISYVGAWLDDATMALLMREALDDAGIAPPFGAIPDGIELCEREGAGKRVYIVINHSKEERQIALPHRMKDILHNGEALDRVKLAPRDVEVLGDY